MKSLSELKVVCPVGDVLHNPTYETDEIKEALADFGEFKLYTDLPSQVNDKSFVDRILGFDAVLLSSHVSDNALEILKQNSTSEIPEIMAFGGTGVASY
ncbi:MAG: hypothetical protein LBM13_01275, partial [Candidatus Ancillula sp.]|nr:hypothetical protein [Candidatus Ancillula sp.]